MDGEEKVFKGYDWAYQRIHHYDNLIANRTNSFLFSSSILFTGFILLFLQLDGDGAFKVLIGVISAVGIILSICNFFNQIRGVRELQFWISVCRVLEQEECGPLTPLRERELVFGGHMNWIKGLTNRYTWQKIYVDIKAAPLTNFEKTFLYREKFPKDIFHEWTTFRYIIPVSFLILWITALVCTFLFH